MIEKIALPMKGVKGTKKNIARIGKIDKKWWKKEKVTPSYTWTKAEISPKSGARISESGKLYEWMNKKR